VIRCAHTASAEARIAEQRKGREPAEASRGSSHLKLLEDLTVFLTRTEDYQEALEGVVRLVAGALDCEVCSLYSYDPESHKLSLAATVGLPARSIGRVSMDRSEGLVGLVVEGGDIVNVEDALAHKRFKFFPELGEEKFHGFLGVPVSNPDIVLGVLVLQSRRRRLFSRDEIRLMRAVAGQVRATMVNAHLADRLQREEAEREVYRRNMVRAIRRLEAYEAARKPQVGTRRDEGLVRVAGQRASPGFGIGRAFVVKPPVDFDAIEVKTADDPSKERARMDKALALGAADVESARERMLELVPEVGGAMYEALRMVLEDASFARRLRDEIASGLAAESALKLVVTEYVRRFQNIDDTYLRERAVDVRDAGQRVLRHLVGVERPAPDLGEDGVLVAKELTLSDLAAVDHTNLRGIVTASGGETSHAAILAKSLEIPTVVGAEGLLDAVSDGDDLIVDGNAGVVYVRPSAEIVAEYRRLDAQFKVFQRNLEHLRDLPGQTLDGYRIALLANVGLLGELEFVDLHGAEGIGLFRTEFPFMSYRDFPSEDEQVSVYSKVIERMGDRPVTIRTLDIGADKYPAYFGSQKEANPFLGWRSIRISLELESVFHEQLRAILRSVGRGPLRIMFPMVTSVEEIRRVREIFADCVADLAASGTRAPANVELGAMIEVPAAVQRAAQILREVDFASIGTNDLIQYTLAVDRDNRKVAPMYEPFHPAVLHSIRQVVEAARATGRRVAICGEMAGNPVYTLFLLGVGLDELSMGPQYIPIVKKLVRSVRMSDAETIAKELLQLDTVEEVKAHMFACLQRLELVEIVDAFS
jgi:phosphotransferase system enzyme I (PtsP)